MEKNKEFLSKKKKSALLLLVIAGAFGMLLPHWLIISTSASVDHRFFIKIPVPTNIKRGDYLLFTNRWEEYIKKGLGKSDVAIKIVACKPGDKLERKGDDFFCNDKLLNTAIETTSTGKKLPQFNFNGVIPDGSYFMAGTDERSFDSRYYGFIHEKEFIYKGLPIW